MHTMRLLQFCAFQAFLACCVMSDKNSGTPAWNETWVEKLRRHLLLNYDYLARPAQHYNTTTASFHLSIFNLEVDDKKGVMSVTSWVTMRWNDTKLQWNPEDYGGVQLVHFGAHEIWQPDLSLYNSASFGMRYYEDKLCFVNNTGLVSWVSPTVFQSYCTLNFVLWPFETNTCRLTIGSWNYDGNAINVTLEGIGYSNEEYAAREWKILNVTAVRKTTIYVCCPTDPYIAISYYLTFQRSSELYYYVIFPVSIPIIFMVLTTFWISSESEVKLMLNVSALIIDILLMLYFGFTIPSRPDNNVPLIVRFFSACLYQMSFSLLISIFAINIRNIFYNESLPRQLRSLLYGRLGYYLGLRSIIVEIEVRKVTNRQESRDHPSNTTTLDMTTDETNENRDDLCIVAQSKDVQQLEWTLLATAIDRISFVVFSIVFIILSFAYIQTKNEPLDLTSDAESRILH